VVLYSSAGIGGGVRERKKSPTWQTRRDSAPLRNWLTHSLREYTVVCMCSYSMYYMYGRYVCHVYGLDRIGMYLEETWPFFGLLSCRRYYIS